MSCIQEHEFTVGYLFCGAGVGAYGADCAQVEVDGHRATVRNVGGIDFEQERCNTFTKLTGAKSLCADIGRMRPRELRAFFGERAPYFMKWSPPCKGASRLTSKERAATKKYQDMNRLAVKAARKVLAAWQGEARPVMVVIENVPAYRHRCPENLAEVVRLGRRAGYEVSVVEHDLGEEAGLAQRRQRLTICWRDAKRCPVPVAMPSKKRLRGVGEVLGPLPFPDDPRAGKHHRLPKIEWLNAVRLALVPPGGDWRDLPPRGGVVAWLKARGLWPAGVDTGPFRDLVEEQLGTPVQQGQQRREVHRRHPVQAWAAPAPTVAGPGGAGLCAVEDPRGLESLAYGKDGRFTNQYRVGDWDSAATCVTGVTSMTAGMPSAADPRALDALGLGHAPRRGAEGVTAWDAPAPTVRGVARHDNGGAAVADPRALEGVALTHARGERFADQYRVQDWSAPGRTVTGATDVQAGAPVVADARPLDALALRADGRAGTCGVIAWDGPAGTVIGMPYVSGGSTPVSVADPRLDGLAMGTDNPLRHRNKYAVTGWGSPSGTVTAASRPGSGAPSVADQRVLELVGLGQTATGAGTYAGRPGLFGVMDERAPAPTVSGSATVSSSNTPAALADSRAAAALDALGVGPTCRNGFYGVLEWDQPARTVTGSLQVDNGSAAIADPRPAPRPVISIHLALALLAEGWEPPKGALAPAILSPLSGCWHRPLTTLELAVLQGLPPVVDGQPLEFVSSSDARVRSMVGDGIPAGGALVWQEEQLLAALKSKLGHGWSLVSDFWFRPGFEGYAA
ncbi:DNA cytosine methyltransferase [Corallococcus exercitus]|uniref:DNA cytosine methyltransferase n=1 Tax=Corallococcus exercitus TaxID=2316736 RepID=A0A7Y4KR99_9BACT|nr:DNA cytosine methyltransferase [Corallococcus exercitus]NOK38522.1 DNA cytosine methyltransferase [Corallococcus exercitus]